MERAWLGEGLCGSVRRMNTAKKRLAENQEEKERVAPVPVAQWIVLGIVIAGVASLGREFAIGVVGLLGFVGVLWVGVELVRPIKAVHLLFLVCGFFALVGVVALATAKDETVSLEELLAKDKHVETTAYVRILYEKQGLAEVQKRFGLRGVLKVYLPQTLLWALALVAVVVCARTRNPTYLLVATLAVAAILYSHEEVATRRAMMPLRLDLSQ